jgi:DNA-binding MarR family transcriptional regulator
MIKKNKNLKNYFAFIENVRQFYLKTTLPKMDALEIEVLNHISKHWTNKKIRNVVVTMNETPGMSPASVHRKLKSLSSKGYIYLEIDINDPRQKNILLTPLAITYFDGLGRCMP